MDKIKTGIVRDEKNPDTINVVVGLDSGLGIFDAFFASFSMILVSEVSVFVCAVSLYYISY